MVPVEMTIVDVLQLEAVTCASPICHCLSHLFDSVTVLYTTVLCPFRRSFPGRHSSSLVLSRDRRHRFASRTRL